MRKTLPKISEQDQQDIENIPLKESFPVDCIVKWHYELGQRVKRDNREGKIIKRYDKMSTYFGYYPELYSVEFDDGKIEIDFLWHGLVSI